MKRTVLAFGWVWLLGPLGLLCVTIWNDVHSSFLSFGYYFVSWASLLFLAFCGAWFLIGLPGSNTVLRIAAVTVAIYAALLWFLTEGCAAQMVYAGLAALLTFCGASFWVAGHRAT